MIWLNKFLRVNLGIDAAIFYSVGSKMIQAVSQLAALYFISIRLSPVEQGYYYTFQSVVALQILFELGMGGVLVQVVSHELAKSARKVDGINESSMGSLIRFVARWYAVSGVLFAVILIPIGLFFFRRGHQNGDNVNWTLPWIFLVVATSLVMLFQASTGVIEGLGRVKQANKYRAVYTMCMGLGLVGSLIAGFGLFSSFCGVAFGVFCALFLLLRHEYDVVKAILRSANAVRETSWWREIWGFQWRMAVSNISGYAIFQFSTPMLFVYLGPVMAGKYGMIQQVVNGISGISMAWVATKQAHWGRFVADKMYTQLDESFRDTAYKSLAANLILSFGFMGTLLLARGLGIQIVERFPSAEVCIVLFVSSAINQLVFARAIYIRSHKVEPMMVNSICSALFVAISSLMLAKIGIIYVAIAYLFNCVLFGHIWVGMIYKKKRAEHLSTSTVSTL